MQIAYLLTIILPMHKFEAHCTSLQIKNPSERNMTKKREKNLKREVEAIE